MAIFFKNLDGWLYIQTIVLIAGIIYGTLIIIPSFQIKRSYILVLIFELCVAIFLTILFLVLIPNSYYLIWDLIFSIFMAMIMAEDLHGLTPIFKSELGEKAWNQGKDQMKVFGMQYKLQPYGTISIEREKCIGCKICLEVCPRDVYTYYDSEKKVDINNPAKCVNCNACVKRCLGHCVSIKKNKEQR
jgi:NAD-dependent dihydropyrimidine dehydrogenase PreA subunit